jgi:hypothetical protein
MLCLVCKPQILFTSCFCFLKGNSYQSWKYGTHQHNHINVSERLLNFILTLTRRSFLVFIFVLEFSEIWKL